MKRLFDIIWLLLFLTCTVNITVAQQVKFNHTYGSMQFNYGRRIIEAGDRGYYIMGNVSAEEGNTQIDVIRTDSLGIILFEKTIGDGPVYWANDFIRTADQGFLFCGMTNKHPANGYDMFLIKTDSNINIEWQQCYGGSGWEIANSVKATKDNAYLLVGQTYSYGPANGNIYVVKTNLEGDTLWTRTFGSDSVDYASDADILSDSTYLIGATTNSFGHGKYDGYVLNLNKAGDTLWTKTYGEADDDILNSISCTPDSGFVFAGTTKNYGAIDSEYWLQKFDKNNVLKWKMPEFWEIKPGENVINEITVTDSSRYLLTGYVTEAGNGGRELTFLVFNENHIFNCSMTAGTSQDEEGFDVLQTQDKGYCIIGYSNELGPGITNIYFIKTGNDCTYPFTSEHTTNIEELYGKEPGTGETIYPNISSGSFYLDFVEKNSDEKCRLMVFNIWGELVLKELSVTKSGKHQIDLSSEPDGMYIIVLSSDKSSNCFRVIKSGN